MPNHQIITNYIHFSVLGCGEPPLNGNQLIERTDQKAVLQCEHTDASEILTCENSQWDKEAPSCSGM